MIARRAAAIILARPFTIRNVRAEGATWFVDDAPGDPGPNNPNESSRQSE